jgi:tryptophanyl-tRNA synthetase
MPMTKTILNGVQVTGKSHLGNYFGSIKQCVELQNSGNKVFLFVANLHSLTTIADAKTLKENTFDLVKDYLACGLDPDKVTMFLQSDMPQHTELTWIFDCLITVPFMERAHAFKDKVANGIEPTMGLFNYPVLMSADILLYSPDLIPVGADQKQHVEYARDIAGYYNRAYNVEEFKLPKDLIVESVASLPGIDGQKMSKSYNNHIELFCSDEDLKKRVMSIVTDSASPEEKKNPDENNIYKIHRLFLNDEENRDLRAKFENGGYGYKQAKEELLTTLMKWREGKKEKYDELVSNPSFIFSL